MLRCLVPPPIPHQITEGAMTHKVDKSPVLDAPTSLPAPPPGPQASPDKPPTVGAPPATEGASVKEPGAPVKTETQGKKEPAGGTTHVKEEYGYIVTNQRSSNPNVHKHWNVGVGAYICLSVYVSVSESLTVHGVCM